MGSCVRALYEDGGKDGMWVKISSEHDEEHVIK